MRYCFLTKRVQFEQMNFENFHELLFLQNNLKKNLKKKAFRNINKTTTIVR